VLVARQRRVTPQLEDGTGGLDPAQLEARGRITDDLDIQRRATAPGDRLKRLALPPRQHPAGDTGAVFKPDVDER
jgi:hypothetical protein